MRVNLQKVKSMVKESEDIMMGKSTRVNSNKERDMDMEKFNIQRQVSGTRANGVLM